MFARGINLDTKGRQKRVKRGNTFIEDVRKYLYFAGTSKGLLGRADPRHGGSLETRWVQLVLGQRLS